MQSTAMAWLNQLNALTKTLTEQATDVVRTTGINSQLVSLMRSCNDALQLPQTTVSL